jgi:hypothetical protein
MSDSVERQLIELCRVYGGVNVVWGAANALSTSTPDEYGVVVADDVDMARAIALVFEMASCHGGPAKIAALIRNGALEECASLACDLSEQCAHTGVVAIHHLMVTDDRGEVHSVVDHRCILAECETLDEALRFAADRGLEVARHCQCYRS